MSFEASKTQATTMLWVKIKNNSLYRKEFSSRQDHPLVSKKVKIIENDLEKTLKMG